MSTDTHSTSVIGKGRKESAQKVLIAYHAHCIDGYTSAWACWRGLLGTTSVLDSNITFIEMIYGSLQQMKDIADSYDKIYMVDFSVPVEDLRVLTSVAEVVIIDHHKTAIEMYKGQALPEVADLIFDINECGASLVWKYFFPNAPLPHLIQVVRDYDLWRFEFPYTKAVNMYLRLQDKSLINWQRLEGVFENPERLDLIFTVGKAMLAYHNSVVAELVEQAERCEIDGEIGLCVNCSPQFSSDVGHALAEKSDSYGATWQQEPGGKVKWSLRSDDIVDVAALAAKFGGGGHKDAAGFYLKAPTDDATKLGITLWAE